MSFVMPINKLIQAIVARNFTNGLTIVWPWPDQFLFQGLIYPLNDLMVKLHSLISRACCPGLIMVWLWSNWWSFNHGRPWSNWRSFIVSSRSCCSRLTMVDHGQIDGHVLLGWPWSTMVWLWSNCHFMVSSRSCFLVWPWSNWWSFHGQWKVMLSRVDHGRPWSDQGHVVLGWPWSTMVWPWSNWWSFHGQLKVMLFWVDHGRPWFDHGQIDGHFMVSWRSCCPGLTMVNHGLTMVNMSDLTIIDHDMTMTIWPWSTMVMTIVPFNKRGRPWSDHGQFMVILWSTMVMDHDRPWSEHGRPWSDHDPAARATIYSSQNTRGF